MIEKLKTFARTVKREIHLYQLVLRHKRTPLAAKLLLAVAVGYILMPFDLIPDFLPIVGQLDDIIIVPALFIIARKLVPAEVMQECRAKVLGDSPNIGV